MSLEQRPLRVRNIVVRGCVLTHESVVRNELAGLAAHFWVEQLVVARARLELDEASWLPKPGLARHMGVARWTR